jgi:ketosteroid isomerase-like protein
VNNKMTSRVLIASVSLALLLAAGSASAAQTGVRAAIEKANGAFTALLAKGDAAGLAALYTADGQVLPPNGDIASGAAGIQKVWQGAMDAGVKSATLTTLDVTAGGDLASETGKYELRGADGKVLDGGKYVVVWKREGGRWKIHRDIWNTSMPMSAPAR